jgi:hypothetical protein
MILFLALIPATMLSIAGLVALYVSARSEGTIKTVGRFLGYWAFTLAVLVILASVVAASHMRGMRGAYHRPMGPMRGPPIAAPNEPTPGTLPNPGPQPNASQR